MPPIRKWRSWLNIRRFVWSSVTLAALVFYSGHGWAVSWQHAGTARVSAEYDANPTMVPALRVGIWRSTFEPSYTLKNMDGANELSAGLALHIARSSHKTLSQNREDPSVFFDWRRQSDAGEFGMSARYDEAETRIAEINNTGPGYSNSTRASRTMSVSWSRPLSELSTLALNGAYNEVSYKGGSFVDYVTRSGGMMFSYTWSERSAPFLSMSYTDSEPIGGNSLSRSVSATLGWNWNVSDNLGGSLQAGQAKTSGSTTSKQGAATVQYTGKRTGLGFNANRQVSPSGLGGFVTVDQANGSWNYSLSERSNAGIDLGWVKSHSDTDIINSTSGAWLQHELNSFWRARTYYTHRISQQGGVGGASSNILGIALVYTHTNF